MTDENKKASLISCDPKTIDKKSINPKADEMNFVALTQAGKPYLGCGAQAKSKRKGDLCHLAAGQGTPHKGYGRCKYHGGLSTGPITPEGKAKTAQNSRLHGLYAKTLLPKEVAIFGELMDAGADAMGLKFEILTLKAKIIAYLAKWTDTWVDIAEKEGEGVADDKTKIWFNEGENGKARNYFHAGTIEDRTLDRALNTLRRLVDAYSKANPLEGGDIITAINSELRAASHGQVSVSWGGKAQTKGGADSGDD